MSEFLNTPEGRKAMTKVEKLIDEKLNPLRKKVETLEKKVEALEARLLKP
jgi:hypothetical protein